MEMTFVDWVIGIAMVMVIYTQIKSDATKR
jgi:hypothetical protein